MIRYEKLLVFIGVLWTINISAKDTILCESPFAEYLDLRPIVLLDPDFDGQELIWDKTKSMVIDSLRHDFTHESYVELQIDSSQNGMIHVQPMWSAGESMTHVGGWVILSNRIITYSSSDILPLFVYPSCDSTYVETKVYSGMLIPVLNFYNGWVYSTYQDISGSEVTGWIPRLYQCPNVYTTCN